MQRELPTGTVTFLFTDIEGSTRLLQELGAGYADVLAEHHRALRAVWCDVGGVEVDTAGDAFFVAFARASEAGAAAADAQRTLAAGPVRVRMGIHTGEPLAAGRGVRRHRRSSGRTDRSCRARRPGAVVASLRGSRRCRRTRSRLHR